MSGTLNPPLAPRQGPVLRILAICRISTENQDERSLDDQENLLRGFVARNYDGPTQWHVIKSVGSGECLDRKELLEAIEQIDAGIHDVIITEDLGRISRRTQVFTICEAAEDQGSRLIAINDNVDTGQDGWENNAFLNSFRHQSFNRDTAKRIRRSLRNRFLQGGVIQFVLYGYDKPPGATNDSQLSKDPAAEPIYRKWFEMLDAGAPYSEVADWLNAQGIRPGPSARKSTWDVALVRETTMNPILKGIRVRNKRISVRVNRTGRHKSVLAPPEELLVRPVPHLAFFDAEYYDRVTAKLRERNARYARGRQARGPDRRKGLPRKRTVWPGQHLTCGVCGRLYYYGGHGRNEFLMCSGSREYRCWNGATASGPLLAERVSGAILEEISRLPEFDTLFRGRLQAQANIARVAQAERLAQLVQQLHQVDVKVDRITDAIASGLPIEPLRDKLQQLQAEKSDLELQRADLERNQTPAVELPAMSELKGRIHAAFSTLAKDSPEFGRLMHQLITRLEVRPYRPIDGGHVVLRAHVRFDLAALDLTTRPLGESGLLSRELVVDLFDPPQRIAFLERVKGLRDGTRTERQVAQELGLTQPAVQHSIALSRKLQARGLSDPYELVIEPPTESDKLCRHRHQRYRFEPLPGHHWPPRPDTATDVPAQVPA